MLVNGSLLIVSLGRSRDGMYEPVLADSEREAVADLLAYLENVKVIIRPVPYPAQMVNLLFIET